MTTLSIESGEGVCSVARARVASMVRWVLLQQGNFLTTRPGETMSHGLPKVPTMRDESASPLSAKTRV